MFAAVQCVCVCVCVYLFTSSAHPSMTAAPSPKPPQSSLLTLLSPQTDPGDNASLTPCVCVCVCVCVYGLSAGNFEGVSNHLCSLFIGTLKRAQIHITCRYYTNTHTHTLRQRLQWVSCCWHTLRVQRYWRRNVWAHRVVVCDLETITGVSRVSSHTHTHTHTHWSGGDR